MQTCRICWETCDSKELVSPCDCTGTMKFVHFLCLQKWVVVKNSNICDICKASLKDLPQGLLQTVRRELVHEDHHLPMNLKIGMAIMWVYTGAIILLPLFIRHLEGKAL